MTVCIVNQSFYVACLLLFGLASTVHAYKPVILFHGLLDDAKALAGLEAFIKETHPGTEVHNIDLFDNLSSMDALWKQLISVKNATKSIMASAKDGVHLLCFSQGGLVGRGLLQTMNNHNVINFIALSSPLNGQYGDTSYLKRYFPSALKKDLYEIFYSKVGQLFSVGNYWKDPHHDEMYRKYSVYLAALNNESSWSGYSNEWQKNFARLSNLVLIGGPDDGVITPWQSSQFGCYNEKEEVVPMRNLPIYKDNVFGLKSLDQRGVIHECTVPNIEHTHWHKNKTVFDKCIEPWLT